MRRSNIFLFYMGINLFLFSLMFIHAAYKEMADRPLLEERSKIVRSLELTDLCLHTEANYTRHLSQADLHTPFQNYPMSLEHFSSGSILLPPEMIKKIGDSDITPTPTDTCLSFIKRINGKPD
jgi:hypothetical protein